MGWHSDAEKLKKELSPVSFGAERKFTFKHKTGNNHRTYPAAC
jgi:alkylated DNA repair dioxygenase AlkB